MGRPLDRNCLSYWFPKLEAAGIPVPRTEIVRTDIELYRLLDGQKPEGFAKFLEEYQQACFKIAPTPRDIFLRTGQGSGKHNWMNCCHYRPADKLERNVTMLVCWSAEVDFLGLPTDVWVAREMLPVSPLMTLKQYGNMPLVIEARCFIRDGEVICKHPYWPMEAIAQGCESVERYSHEGTIKILEVYNRQVQELGEYWQATKLAEDVAKVFKNDGAWSVDILKAENGWFVTDLAEASRSYHWDGCPHAESFR